MKAIFSCRESLRWFEFFRYEGFEHKQLWMCADTGIITIFVSVW